MVWIDSELFADLSQPQFYTARGAPDMISRKRVILCSAILGFCAVFAGPSASDPNGQVDRRLFDTLHWRNIGPFLGGRVLAVAGIPGEPLQAYFGAVAGGVWKTTDAGTTWKPISDHAPFSSIGAIAVAPSNPNIVYVGTGEAAPRGDITYGEGVYRSVDGGISWTAAGLTDSRHIGAIVIHPKNPDIIFVAALGHVFGPNTERGLYRTTNGGKTWLRVLANGTAGAIDVVFDRHNPKILYATLWNMLRQPWNFSTGGADSGLYKSLDGGTTWQRLTGNGLPTGLMGRIGISVSGANSRRLYAVIEAADGGLFRSDDSGVHWTRINNDGRLTQRTWYFSKVYADPNLADTVYVLNTGLFKSTDAGRSFKLLHARHEDHHGLWIDPTNSNHLINGNDGGASVSLDGGRSWSTEDNQPTGQFYRVATDSRFPYFVYGSQQDRFTYAIASASDEGAIGPGDMYQVGYSESGYVAPDPNDPLVAYVDGENLITRFDRRTHQSQFISVWPVDASGHPASELEHRFNWTSPLITSAHSPNTLYWGAERLFRSNDSGHSWSSISGDLTRNDKSKQGPSGGPIIKDITSVEYYDTIFSIGESPRRAGLLWVGTDDGLVHKSMNDGGDWTNVTPRDLPGWSTVSSVNASHFDEGTAYLSAERHRFDDNRPYIFKTHDGGKSWTRIDAGLPDGAYVHTVREDLIRPGLLFVATEKGPFVSFDEGNHWQSLKLDLPPTPIYDLTIKGDDIVVATHGRGFWILDDITPLRQIDVSSAEADTILFKPQKAYRLYFPFEVDKRRPVGENPPAGALIDYYLKSKPSGEVTLDIFDADGHEVRHVSDRESEQDRQPEERPNMLEPTDTIPAHPGLNRFVWDFRYDAPTAIPGAFYSYVPPLGPLVPPGHYVVKLTMSGTSWSVPLEVALDPRVKDAEQAVREKFGLALEVHHDQEALHRAVNDIRKLRSQLEGLSPKLAGHPDLVNEVKGIVDRSTSIEDELIQSNIKGGEGNLNFAGMLNEQIYMFALQLGDADAAPTEPQLATYRAMHEKLSRLLDSWGQVRDKDLPTLQQHLSAVGLSLQG
jgi:photosystem II stability/assembly factor-like uncharacterized protein